MIVAIHQPNYMPWLGYFYKISRADCFVLLDDAGFSKNSVTNRVKILHGAEGKWLSVPVSASMNQPINAIQTSKPAWCRSHIDTLRQFYRKAPAFKQVFGDIEALYADAPSALLGDANIHFIEGISRHLGIDTAFHRSSGMELGDLASDDRLVEIVRQVDAQGIYLSGSGGRKYQDEGKFAAAGLGLQYSDFEPKAYPQNAPEFVPGLSILDAVFHLGWQDTRALLTD